MKRIAIEKLIRPDLIGMMAYSSARDEYSGNASVYLDANENPYNNGVNRYPDPLQLKLKERISEIKNVSKEQLFLGNGSDECIDLLFRLFCISGKDQVTAINPSYGMYSVSARINQIKLNESKLNIDFSLNTEQIIKDAEGSKLLFICSPNNPTGNSFPKEQLIEILTRFDGIVVIDEAYIDFADDESMLTELLNFSNLVVCQTFSKAHGMAGIRLGMLFASPEIISWMNKIKPPYNINQLTQTFAFDKLVNLNQVQNEIESIKKERSFLLKELARIQCVEKVYPSASNFILIKVKNTIDSYNYLKNNGIVVRNRSSQLLCENCLRLTIGTPEENLLLLKTLKEMKYE